VRSLTMAAITGVYTIKRAAIMLGISDDLLDRIADTMEPEDGVLWIHDGTEDGTRGFTSFGLDNVREILDDPSIMEDFLQNRA
jgi:hypothetical protein